MEVDILHSSISDISGNGQKDVDLDSDFKSKQHHALVSNLSRCQGSAMYTFGDNIVQCSLFGPSPVSTNVNLLKKNYFNVYLYPLGKIKNLSKDKSLTYYEYFFKRTFIPVVYHALLPRSRTYMVLNEIEKGSSFVTTALNAASIALIDSGFPLNFCIGACGIILDKDGSMFTEKEYKEKFEKHVRTYEPLNINFETPDTPIQATFYTVLKNTKPIQSTSFVAEGKFSLQHVIQAQKKSEEPVSSFFEYLKNFVKERFV